MDKVYYDIEERLKELTVEDAIKEIETIDLSTTVPDWIKQ